jgi:hypothetical protein
MAASGDDPSSLVSLLTSALVQIQNASSSRKHKQLHEVSAAVIDELKNLQSTKVPPVPQGLSPAARHSTLVTDADRFFLPLKLACESKVAKCMEVALDCMQKLIAYGYLRGNSAIDRTQYPLDSPASKSDASSSAAENAGGAASAASSRSATRKLIDMIIETIYECSSFQDDNVQLQVQIECVWFPSRCLMLSVELVFYYHF